MPLLSVVTPFYNSREHLPAMLASLSAQTLSDFEAIFVDDASDDDGAAIIARHGDKRCRIISNSSNRGNAAARNRGLAAVIDSPFIAVFDADDIAHPQRFEKQAALLRDNTELSGCGTFLVNMFPNGRTMDSTRECDPALVAAQALFEIPLAHTTCVFRREIFDRDGFIYDDETASGLRCKDYDLMCRLIVAGKALANLPEFLMHKRIHTTSVTFASLPRAFAGNVKARRHLFERLGLQGDPRLTHHHHLCDWLEWPNQAAPPDFHMADWFQTIASASREAGLFAEAPLSALLDKVLATVKQRSPIRTSGNILPSAHDASGFT